MSLRPRPSTAVRSVLVLSASLLLARCGRVADDAVAVWDGGHLTARELELRILELPAGERRPEDGDFAAWHQRLAREAALEEILAAEARQSGLTEDPEARRALAELESEALAAAYLERRLPPLEPVTEDDVRALYEERREALARPAQRVVYHLFRRREPGMPTARLRAELLALRRRIVDGESFALVAREHSQSETRHRDGLMGTFRRGQVDPKLGDLLFELPVKTPSEPMLTPQGGHLFWIETASEERRFELADVGRDLVAEIRRERRGEAIDALVAGVELPAGSYLPADDDLRVLLSSAGGGALVLRVGDFDLRFAQLAERLSAAPPSKESWQERGRRLVKWLERRERLALAARGEGLDREPEVAARLERLASAELARRRAEQRMLADAGEREMTLRAFYENNRSRYSEPLRLLLDRLRVPIDDPGLAASLMARLEGASRDPGPDQLDLAALAAELGGELEPLEWMSFERLRRQLPRAAELVAPLGEGAVTPPFRTAEHLEMLRVRERREPAALPFEAARERVAQDYLEAHGQTVYRQLSDRILRARGYRPLIDRLADASRPGA